MLEPLFLSMLDIPQSLCKVHNRSLNYFEHFLDKATEALKDLVQSNDSGSQRLSLNFTPYSFAIKL